jgi:hypothetical protein
MELMYGCLGLFTLPSFVALSFSIQEYYGDGTSILNREHPNRRTSLDIELCNESNGTENGVISLNIVTWRSIVAKCVLNDMALGWVGTVEDLKEEYAKEYSYLKDAKLRDDGGLPYDYAIIHSLGFCPDSAMTSASAVSLC